MSQQSPAPPHPPQDTAPQPGLGELLARMSDNMMGILRGEISLAKARLQRLAKVGGLGATLLSVAGILFLFALGFLLTAAAQALSLVLPAWAASLIVVLVLLLVATPLAVTGLKRLQQAKAQADGLKDTPAQLRDDPQALRTAVTPGLTRDKESDA